MNGQAPTRPALRYHGGKWRLAPWIISHFPEHRIYVEPFGGAASVLLRKPRSYAEVYNDLDGELCNLFLIIRDRGAELRRALYYTPFARDEFALSYQTSDDPLEQARRTVIRSFMGFGSNAHHRSTGFRSNSNRSNTTGAHDWKSYPEALSAMIERIRGVVIENRSAVEVIRQHDSPETLFYADPPYPSGVRDPGDDYAHEMTDDDHRELAETLRMVRGMVVISGYPCDLYDRELYPDWRRFERQALADGARKRTEVLWISPNVQYSGFFPEWEDA
jgi:DNA adenine methylase